MWSTDRLRVGSGEAGTCGGHACGPGEGSALCVQRFPGCWTASLPLGPERQLNRPPPPRHMEHRLLREAGQEQTAVGTEGRHLPRRASRSLLPGGAQVPHQHTCQGSLSPTCRSSQVIDLSLQQCRAASASSESPSLVQGSESCPWFIHHGLVHLGGRSLAPLSIAPVC